MNSQKCIWMECGYIEYKLCDRNFDCENCPFDKAMKQDQKIDTNSPENLINDSAMEKYFTRNHVWFISEGNHFSLGLDDFAKNFFDRNCTISFPIIGSMIFERKTFLWLVGSFGAIGFQSPINGRVYWINHDVKMNTSNFFSARWNNTLLVKVETENISNYDFRTSEIIMDGNEYQNFLENENRLVKEFLLSKFYQTSKLKTLPDGGEFLKDYINLLSKSDYFQLLKLLFNKKLQGEIK